MVNSNSCNSGTEGGSQHILLCNGDILVPDRHSDSIFWPGSEREFALDVHQDGHFVGVWRDKPCWVSELDEQQAEALVASGGDRIRLQPGRRAGRQHHPLGVR